MKPFFPTLIGNERLLAQLGREITENCLGHAYILEGPAGTGKHTLAMQIAAALACERKNEDGVPLPCMECAACRKILSGNSPDVILKGRADKATIGVEPVREVRNFAFMEPNELDDKIFIIEDAQTMTPQAQNALLLILEEPPAYIRFLLLTDGSIPLLETIRSRAPTLRLASLGRTELQNYLLQTEPEAKRLQESQPEEFEEWIAAGAGSVGMTKKLLDPKARQPVLENRRLARTFAELAANHSSPSRVLTFLSDLGNRRDEVIERFSLMLLCVRDLILQKQAEEDAPLCFFYDREDAAALAYRFTVPELLRDANEIANATDSLRRNANVRLVLVRFAMRTGLLPN